MVRAWWVVLWLAGCRLYFEETDPDGGATGEGGAADGGDAATRKNLVFVTLEPRVTPAEVRARGGGDMLAGGDAICAEHAALGGLPGTYIALLSGGTIHAVDRLAGSRGWYRLDGLPFADTPASLFTARQVFYPIVHDARGTVQATRTVMTGTGEDGKARNDCQGWTATTDAQPVFSGNSTDGSDGWSSRYIPGCASALHLYCFGIGNTAPVAITPQAGRRAFVSQPWTPGGGLAAADARCQQDATAGGLTGTYRAMLATSTASAVSRLAMTGTPWVRLDGIPIVAAPGDLATKQLLAPLSLKADGQTYYGQKVWSGATQPTLTSSSTCVNWTVSAAASGGHHTQASNGPGTFFTESYTEPCSTALPVYCFEQ